MDKFSFETLLLNLKTKSGSNDLSKNQDIIELAQIVGVKEINDKDALYDGIIKFISNHKKEIETHIRCFLDEDRRIADSENNIIILYILYDRYKNRSYKDKVSKCIEDLGDENSNKLLKVGKLLFNLFRTYYNDYYSIVFNRAESFIKSIDEKINTINEPNISYGNRAERSKNDLTKKILPVLLILVLLSLALLGFVFYKISDLENKISGLEGRIKQLEEYKSGLKDRIQQLEQQISELKQQNNESEKQSDNQQTGSSKKSKSSKKSEKKQ